MPDSVSCKMKDREAIMWNIDSVSGACHNKECPFLHIDPETKIKDCPWYDRGFCRHGPTCRHRHVRRNRFYIVFQRHFPFIHLCFRCTLHELHRGILSRWSRVQICPVIAEDYIFYFWFICNTNYQLFSSPRFELPPLPDDIKGDKRKMPLVCHFCGEVGHKAGKLILIYCTKTLCQELIICFIHYICSTMSENSIGVQRYLSYSSRCFYAR